MSNADFNPTESGHSEDSGRLSDPAELTPESFDSHVGELFRVSRLQFEHQDTHTNPIYVGEEGECEIIELKLVEVTRYPKLKDIEGGFDHRPREPFALLFEGPAEPILMSALHTVEHDKLGKGRLFLNPVQMASKAGRQQPVRFYETPIS